LPSIDPRDMKISDLLHLDMINIITKFHPSRIDREGNVVKFVCVKIDKIVSKFEFLQKVKSHYLDNR
jgi:hypothetical protein